MKKTLQKELSKMDDIEFFVLEHSIKMARCCRDLKISFELSDKEMADKLAVSVADLKKVFNCAYEMDLRFWAKYQAYSMELNEARTREEAKIKVEATDLKFAAYKYTIPVAINKLEELIDKLDTGMYKKSEPLNP